MDKAESSQILYCQKVENVANDLFWPYCTNLFIKLFTSVTEMVGGFGIDNIGVTAHKMRCICVVCPLGDCLP